ncbi:MAG: glycosyltransferase family 8 protein, partial [Candidatus Gastranaerophilales bacterium]|nr:glycosyltransferase family 8 protein [Candidatus Gastranaerophilales bacterium]
MQEYNICYSLDSAYMEQLNVSIVSILKNAEAEDNINFYILDGGLTNKDKNEIKLLKNIKTFNIKFIPVNKEDFAVCPLLKDKDSEHKNYHVSLPTYYRFKLPDFLKDLDKVLYFDCDVIVRSSLKKLYNTNLKDKAAAMVLDVESKKEAKRLNLKNYYNAGVMLINLDFWRKNKTEEKLFKFTEDNKETILWQDQDVINCVLADKIVNISKYWNYQYFLYDNIEKDMLSECGVLHLAGRFKPWLLPFENFVYDEYYYYLSFTVYSNKILEYKQKAAGKFLKGHIGGNNANILITAADEDIQNVYNSITNNYKYTDG